MDNFYAVIMAGGKGERFWPLSTSKTPKQVLSLVGGKPMIQMAVERVDGIIPPERVIVVTSADLVDVTCKAAPQLPERNVIGEPFGRDTAAAVALASAIVKSRTPNGVFCILTADHVIKNQDLFRATLMESARIAENNDVLITMGIKPTFPSTGFGYIEFSSDVENDGRIEFKKADKFVEKPDTETAAGYIKAGNYCWNSGMFIWSVKSIQTAFGKYQPQLMAMADAMETVVDSAEFNNKLREEYEKLGKISIDYAIMEHAENIIMARGTFGWFDVGSWPALKDHFDSDLNGNIFIGDVEAIDSSSNIVFSEERLTTLIGVDNLVVVQAGNATLICSKDRAQDVKQMVQLLKDKGCYENVL